MKSNTYSLRSVDTEDNTDTKYESIFAVYLKDNEAVMLTHTEINKKYEKELFYYKGVLVGTSYYGYEPDFFIYNDCEADGLSSIGRFFRAALNEGAIQNAKEVTLRYICNFLKMNENEVEQYCKLYAEKEVQPEGVGIVCTGKIYDNNSRLIGYKLRDENGQEKQIPTGQLKNAIRTGQIVVSNLELTDNRLKIRKRCQMVLKEFIDDKTSIIELKPQERYEVYNSRYSCTLKIIDVDKNIDVFLSTDTLLSGEYKYTKKRDYIANECGFYGAWYKYTVSIDKNIKVTFSAHRTYAGWLEEMGYWYIDFL